jgi:hypothetical protein
MVIDECEASSRAADRSQNVEGASTSNQADDDQSDEDETDLFLEALLHPDEHAQRLLDVRIRVAELCRVADILDGVNIPMGDILRSVVASFGLLKDAGLMQDSLVVLVDDSERILVVQAVEIDVHEIEILETRWRGHSSIGVLPETTPYVRMGSDAPKLLRMLQMTFNWFLNGRQQINKLGALLALATASYAGSHCHSLGIQLFFPGPGSATRVRHRCHGFQIRSCRFACLNEHIGGPVWVFGAVL